MEALGFFFGTLIPGVLALVLSIALAQRVVQLVRLARRPGALSFSVPLWLPAAVAALWLWNAPQLYHVYACEKWGRCEDAPAWCREGLRELRAEPGGCEKWGPVGCDGGAP
jgi:hypothetical protein